MALEPPKPGLTDHLHTLARVGLSVVPLVGGPAVELFNAIVSPSIEKRRDEWRREIGERLAAAEQNGKLNIDTLKGNDAFIDVVMQATHVAMRNSQAGKRAALRNAVVNCATAASIDETKSHMFLRLVDGFTDWHLKILALFKNPAEWLQANGRTPEQLGILGGSLADLVEKAWPELGGNRELVSQIWKDLYSSGLIDTESIAAHMTMAGVMSPRLSKMGREFLQFVSEPVDVHG